MDPKIAVKHEELRKKIKLAFTDERNQYGERTYAGLLDLDILRILFKQAVKIFHPYDADFLKLTEKLNEALKYEEHQLTVDCENIILKNFYHNFPPYEPNIGKSELDISVHLLAMNRPEECEPHIKKAIEIFGVAYGDDCHSYKHCQEILSECMKEKRAVEQKAKKLAKKMSKAKIRK